MNVSFTAKDSITIYVHDVSESIFYDFVVKNSLSIVYLSEGVKSTTFLIGDNMEIKLFYTEKR